MFLTRVNCCNVHHFIFFRKRNWDFAFNTKIPNVIIGLNGTSNTTLSEVSKGHARRRRGVMWFYSKLELLLPV